MAFARAILAKERPEKDICQVTLTSWASGGLEAQFLEYVSERNLRIGPASVFDVGLVSESFNAACKPQSTLSIGMGTRS